MKINNIKQLQAEKNLISKRCKELENKICHGWNELKKGLVSQKTKQDDIKQSFLKNAFSFGIKLVTQKAVDKVVEKISGIFQRKEH